MRSGLVTGGVQDYVEFVPETVSECADLVRIHNSEFHEQPQIFFLDLCGGGMRLRIYVSNKRPEAAKTSKAQADELDQES